MENNVRQTYHEDDLFLYSYLCWLACITIRCSRL